MILSNYSCVRFLAACGSSRLFSAEQHVWQHDYHQSPRRLRQLTSFLLREVPPQAALPAAKTSREPTEGGEETCIIMMLIISNCIGCAYAMSNMRSYSTVSSKKYQVYTSQK